MGEWQDYMNVRMAQAEGAKAKTSCSARMKRESRCNASWPHHHRTGKTARRSCNETRVSGWETGCRTEPVRKMGSEGRKRETKHDLKDSINLERQRKTDLNTISPPCCNPRPCIANLIRAPIRCRNGADCNKFKIRVALRAPDSASSCGCGPGQWWIERSILAIFPAYLNATLYLCWCMDLAVEERQQGGNLPAICLAKRSLSR
uniref:Uncharacterized protein n=1 Tax=Odontella aurita TaxID=265563 RepID=A0A7S4IMC3_9STRA|mmetsp:Transcript_27337/g.80490  ORF Transcript_27337/g.80490 Transcript_27337/m.80490 type:complete len:204 (+) Transcript_27337:120-731(+)